MINLDNSGSSQFLYDDGDRTWIALPGDINDLTDADSYRPVPNFFGME